MTEHSQNDMNFSRKPLYFRLWRPPTLESQNYDNIKITSKPSQYFTNDRNLGINILHKLIYDKMANNIDS